MPYTTLISCADAHHESSTYTRFIDCRFDLMNPDRGEGRYKQDHLPNAIYAHLDRDLSSPISPGSGRHPLPAIESLTETFSRWGINSEVQVIVYDDNIGMFASRLWWLLRWLGHEKVAVLDGGYLQWKSEGLPLTEALPEITATNFVPNLQESGIVNADEIVTQKQPRYLLVDARARERYRGDIEPIDPVAGHIPGALNYPLTDNINTEGKFKERVCLREQITSVIGTHEPNEVVHYCGSGVSACHNILAMEHAGLHGSKLYPGSWSEWIRDTNHKIATGD